MIFRIPHQFNCFLALLNISLYIGQTDDHIFNGIFDKLNAIFMCAVHSPSATQIASTGRRPMAGALPICGSRKATIVAS